MNGWRGKAVVLGKVPWHDEFLRARGASEELWSFDSWLHDNAHAIHERTCGDDAWHGFFVQREPSAPLRGVAGVLSPSHDRAERPYPLAVVASIDLANEVGGHPEVIPILLESYWNDALEVMTSSRAAPPAADDPHLSDLTQQDVELCSVAVELYESWAQRTEVAELCELLGRPVAWLWQATEALERAVAEARYASIRVPLGQGAGGAVCFWIDVLRRAARWQHRVPSFFWSHDEASGEALLFLEPPDDRVLAALWIRGAARPGVCDLTVHPTPDDPAGDGAASTPVSAFLEAVGTRRG